MLFKCLLLVSVFQIISTLQPIPIRRVSDVDSSEVQYTFLPEDGLNPLRSLHAFCSRSYISALDCRRIGDYLVDMMVLEDGYNDSAPISSYDNDIILHAEGFDGITTPYIWGNIQLEIQLDSLQGSKECSYLTIPVPVVFETELDHTITNFCFIHSLKGIDCLELTHYIRSYLTSLYYYPGGVTLRNLARSVITDEELRYMYFPVDIYNSSSLQTTRYYYVSTPTYFAMDGGKFCVDKQFTRSYCLEFFEHMKSRVGLYYHHEESALIPLLYVLHSLQYISSSKNRSSISGGITGSSSSSSSSSSHTKEEEGFIDADFIEIGTSNFNAVTQLIDMNEPIIGYAIEPYARYLDQLPSPPGVKKLNIAMIPDKGITNSSFNSSSDSGSSSIDKQEEYVDLYYIPEDVIDSLKLAPFLKGCNSIGVMHAIHLAGGHQKYVQKLAVPALTITQLLTSQRIRTIRLLKIDAETYDYVILRELYHYLVAKQDTILYPQRIIFETNPYEPDILQELLVDYQYLGYTIVYMADDVIMEYLNPI